MSLEQEIQYFHAQIEQLFAAAAAKDRDAFFAIADISRQLKDTENKLHHVNAQLQGGYPEELELADSNTLSELKDKQFVENERKERLTEEIEQAPQPNRTALSQTGTIRGFGIGLRPQASNRNAKRTCKRNG